MRFMTRCLCLVLSCFCFSACGASNSNKTVDILGKLELDRVAYSTAQSEAQTATDKAKVAQSEATAAEVARLKAAQALALALEQAARVHESKMNQYRDEVCKYDPGRCGGPTNLVSRSDVPVQFVDGKITFFADGGWSRLPNNAYPDGWQIAFRDAKFVLLVGGQVKASLSDPSSAGKCYRALVGEFMPIACP